MNPAAGLIFWVPAPRLPPPALAALGHPPPLREGGEKLGVFASPTQWGRREHPAEEAGAERRGLWEFRAWR